MVLPPYRPFACQETAREKINVNYDGIQNTCVVIPLSAERSRQLSYRATTPGRDCSIDGYGVARH